MTRTRPQSLSGNDRDSSRIPQECLIILFRVRLHRRELLGLGRATDQKELSRSLLIISGTSSSDTPRCVSSQHKQLGYIIIDGRGISQRNEVDAIEKLGDFGKEAFGMRRRRSEAQVKQLHLPVGSSYNLQIRARTVQ